jgi:S1-C subfamily serine protease
MITLNYSPNRWLGNAIPIDFLKPRLKQLLEKTKSPEETGEQPEAEGYLGFTVKHDGKNVVVDKVDPKGPAQSQGIFPGDVIESIGGKSVKTVEEFMALTKGLKAGSVLWIKLQVGEVKLQVVAKPKPK